jgi:hypothetical protein
MHPVAHARRSTARLFAVYAVVSLIPILALGLILASHFRQEAQQRGVDQARAEAQLIAQTAVQPLFDDILVSRGLSPAEVSGMRRLARQTVASRGEGTLRLQLRDLHGRVVFADDGSSDTDGPVDDDALEAATGETVAHLTNLNADDNPNTRARVPSRSTCPCRPDHRCAAWACWSCTCPMRRSPARSPSCCPPCTAT